MHFTSLQIRDKFPKWYPRLLADSLAPWGVQLVVYTDQEGLTPRSNVEYRKIDPSKVPATIKEAAQGWWYKALFWNPEFCEEERILFIDLDTLCLNDPAPILNYSGPGMTLMPWTPETVEGKHRLLSAGLVFVDHAFGLASVFWERLLSLPVAPAGCDDFWLSQQPEESEIMLFPPRFQFIYNYWRVHGCRMDSCITLAFPSMPDFCQVISQKLRGHEELRRRLPYIEMGEGGKKEDFAREKTLAAQCILQEHGKPRQRYASHILWPPPGEKKEKKDF